MISQSHRASPFRWIAVLPAMLSVVYLALTGCDCSDNKKPATTGHAAAAVVPCSNVLSSAARAPQRHNRASSAQNSSHQGISTGRPLQPAVRYKAGEDPEFARRSGWPVSPSPLLPGSILPQQRIVAFYGNPLCKKMGILGELPKNEMLQQLKREAARWQMAEPTVKVQPALHLIAVVAQGDPGKAGLYRMIITDDIVNRVYGWAKEVNALLFIDIQTGHDDIRSVLPRFEWLLKNPDVHLGIDPEFNLRKCGKRPGTVIGTYDAADINYASEYLRNLVTRYRLPPKLLVVHRFTRNGVTNADKIALRPEVQIIINMDGWGPPWLKRDSYKDYVVTEPVQFTGFKLFYHNDTKKGIPLMTPQDVLKLRPQPLYIQYQ